MKNDGDTPPPGDRGGFVRYLIDLGAAKGTLLITALSVTASLVIAVVVTGALHRLSLMGILIAASIPAVLVPATWYPIFKSSVRLEAMQALLAQSEDRYRSIMSQASDGIVLLDPEGESVPTIAAVNDAACAMHGYAMEEMVGLSISRLDESLTAETAARMHERLARGETVMVETQHRRRDGSTFPVEASSRLVSIGERGFVLSVERDITERKRAEESIREYARRLEHSNRMQELFNDVLSHDILNPATVIAGVASHLAGRIGEEGRNEVNLIVRNCERLIRLINDAAKCARLESVEELETQGEDLTRLVASSIEALEHVCSAAGVEVRFEHRGGVPVRVNRIFEEALTNIISNAVTFSPEGSTVSVAITGDRDFHCVAVKDRGPGIPDALKDLVFQRFTRIEQGSTKGSGLGLAVASRIVNLHGGRIWVEDNPGGGSIFMVSIPKIPAGGA